MFVLFLGIVWFIFFYFLLSNVKLVSRFEPSRYWIYIGKASWIFQEWVWRRASTPEPILSSPWPGSSWLESCSSPSCRSQCFWRYLMVMTSLSFGHLSKALPCQTFDFQTGQKYFSGQINGIEYSNITSKLTMKKTSQKKSC